MISVQKLSKSYGEQVLLDEVDFVMTPGERLGLVGRNGHGKSTLFRLLLGEEQPDDGTIVMPKGYRVGHLSQHLHFDQPTILDDVCVGLGDRKLEERYRAEAALMGLGFSSADLSRPASEFSGGFQIRVNLARVLVEEPNLLLLDEPTNYLDIVSLRWLARFLRGWPHELILVTHDRQFMDSVTTHTMAIHRRGLRRMEGPVAKLYDQIGTDEAVYENTRQNDEKKRKQEERFIERFRSKASKASLVQSRIKQLEKRGRMEALEREDELNFHFNTAPFHATTMLTVHGLGFGYGDGPELIKSLDLTVEKGDRIAIIGPNGRGKTTLLELLAGELKPRRGHLRSNPNTSVAYFGQTHIARLHEQNTIEQELLAARPDQSRTAVRGLCGLLMFSGDAAEKPIGVLSGGERSRVLLGKLLVSPSNLLLLDEPTHHLDIESIEGLLDAVDDFPGAVLMVTHSEMILERVANRLVIFDGGKVTLFEGGYADFLDRIGWCDEAELNRGKSKPATRELRKQKAAIVTERARATAPLKKEVDRLERRIEQFEVEVARYDLDMASAAEAGNNHELVRLAALAKAKRQAIEDHFEQLEVAHEAFERARAEFDQRLEALG